MIDSEPMLNGHNDLSPEDGTIRAEEKCRRWGISPNMLPILKLVFLQGWKISKASKAHSYNGSYMATVIRRLKAEGHDTDIRQHLLSCAKEDIQDLDNYFWESLKTCIQAGDVKALQLYAEIKGLVQKRSPSQPQNNVQVNIDLMRQMLGEED